MQSISFNSINQSQGGWIHEKLGVYFPSQYLHHGLYIPIVIGYMSVASLHSLEFSSSGLVRNGGVLSQLY